MSEVEKKEVVLAVTDEQAVQYALLAMDGAKGVFEATNKLQLPFAHEHVVNLFVAKALQFNIRGTFAKSGNLDAYDSIARQVDKYVEDNFYHPGLSQ